MAGSPASSAPPTSAWTVGAEPLPDTRPLEGARRADVVVVGAGYTGLSAALHLAERGAEVVVLDAAEPGWGASGRNGGQVIPGLKHDPDELERRFGEETGRRMWQTAGTAADFVFELIARHKISCHAERRGWIAAAPHAAALESLRSRTEQWRRRGAPGKPLADRALGVSHAEIGWPVTPVEPIPLHRWRLPAMALVIRWKRFQDWLDAG